MGSLLRPARLVLVLSLLAGGLAREARAEGSLNRAANFLGSRKMAASVIEFAHMGKDYRGHRLKEVLPVRDEDGELIPGQFALVYRYHWGSDGITDLAFLCDRAGVVYALRVLDTNAIVNQPFLAANVSIQLLGNMFLAAYADQMTAEQRQVLQHFVDAADAQGMLTWGLRFQQLLQ